MKKLMLRVAGAFSKELAEELNQFTMAGRWWLAYELSGDDPKVLETLFADAETQCTGSGHHDLAVFEDGSAINWHEGIVCVYCDISDLLGHYDVYRPDKLEAFEAALLDYPVIEKYRPLLSVQEPHGRD